MMFMVETVQPVSAFIYFIAAQSLRKRPHFYCQNDKKKETTKSGKAVDRRRYFYYLIVY
jgi:hypothetical protein